MEVIDLFCIVSRNIKEYSDRLTTCDIYHVIISFSQFLCPTTLKEYSDRLATYDHINHEDQRHHEEADDEHLEANHEGHEIHHESTHHHDDHAKRMRIIKHLKWKRG